LKKVSLLEVVFGDDPAEQRRALKWAARRSDIALWCSQGFDEQERALWAGMPDILKDHSFLLLTKADRLARKKQLSDRLAVLQDIIGEDFIDVLALSTQEAIASRRPEGKFDQKALKDSGGAALLKAVMRHVEQGRQAAEDRAEMLLAQYEAQIPDAPKTSEASEDVSAAKPGDDPPAPEPAETPEAPISSAPAPIAEPDIPDETPEALEPAEVFAVYQRAVETIQEAASSLDDGADEPLIDSCLICAEQLYGSLSDISCEQTEFVALRDMCEEVSELLLLLQIEDQNIGTFVEAVTLLLQLRRGFEARLSFAAAA